jgi:hypothetical protein
MSYRDEARRALESRAAHRKHDQYLQQIKHQHPALKRFENVDELLDHLRDPEADPDVKDAALLALIEEHQRAGGGGAFALLAVAMFPALDRIYKARTYQTGDHDDLWGRVVEAFAEALDRYPVARRPARVAANIDGETMATLRRAGLREKQIRLAHERIAVAILPFRQCLEVVDSEDPTCDHLSLGDFVAPGPEPELPPDDVEMEAAARAATSHFDAGEITDQDRFLLLGVSLYGHTLGDLAREIGISREAAKKRHLRAINRLRALGQRKRDRE